jgi:hypothetical protein
VLELGILWPITLFLMTSEAAEMEMKPIHYSPHLENHFLKFAEVGILNGCEASSL